MFTWNSRKISVLCALILSVSCYPHTVSAKYETKLLNVEYSAANDEENITLTLNRSVEYATMKLTKPDRIVVDLNGCIFPETHLVKQYKGNSIKTCRVSQNTPSRTRVVLDVQKNPEYSIFSSTSASRNIELTVKVTTQQSGTDHHEPDRDSKFTETKQSTKQSNDKLKANSFEKVPEGIFSNSSDSDKLWENSENKGTGSHLISGSVRTRFIRDISDENNSNEHEKGILNNVIVSAAYKDIAKLSAKSDYRYEDNKNRYETYDLDLYETYLNYSGDIVSLKAGKFIRRWGKADQFSPVDTLNPEDIRELITIDYEDRKIPVWMADTILKQDHFSIEAVYIPVFKPAEQDYFGSDWAFYRHLKEDISSSNIAPDPLKQYFKTMDVHTDYPDDSGLNGEYALRLTTTINRWDIGATYHRTWEDQPFFKSFPVKNIDFNGSFTEESLMSALNSAVFTPEDIEATYIRSNIFGLEFETTISDFGLRGEAAWHENQPFLTSSLVSSSKPVFYAIVGGDYTGENNWYMNLQLSYSHISDYEDNILYFKEDEYALLGEISREFFSSWVKSSLHYYISLNNNQFYFSPRIEYRYITNLDIILGLHIIEGSASSFIGRYDDNDQIFMDLNYHF